MDVVASALFTDGEMTMRKHHGGKASTKKGGRQSPNSVRPDDGEAFLPDPRNGPAHSSDDLAEVLAQEYLSSATSAEEASESVRDEVMPEEVGGPFVEVSADEEFAQDVDDMNPPDALREPFPTPMRSLDK